MNNGSRIYTSRVTLMPPPDAPGDGQVNLYAIGGDPNGVLDADLGDRAFEINGTNTWTCAGGNVWAASGGGGGLGGTIGVNEVAFGTALDTIGGNPAFLFDGVNLTVATGGSTIDIGQGFITGGPSLTVETMLGGTLTLGNGDAIDLVVAQEIRVNGATGAAGEVLTSNGPGVPPTWQAGGGGGTIGGTIAANEVAFGTGADTIGGSANLTWDNATSALAVIGDAADCLTVASLIDGQFLAVSPTSYTLTITDPLTPTSSATMGPGDVAVGDGAASGNVQAGLVGVTENATGNRITLTAPAGLGTLTSEDSATLVPAPLDVVCGELQVNGAPGALGEVLTSNGPGAAPTWEAPQVLQSVYVAEGADPATANGSPAFPYATISAAMASITDATPTKRYAISVGGGAYSEGATLNIKPNVFVVGAAVGAVRITATTFGMDASFSAGSGVDNRSGYQNVILIGACVFDWSAVTSSAGKLYFTSVSFNSAVTMTGHNSTIAQAQFTSCQFFGTLTVSGINVGVFANNVVFANIVLNQHPSLATVLQTAGGYCSGTLTATTTINTFARRISIFARSFWMGAVTVDGPQTYLDYTVDSLPAAGATVLNGATLVSIDTGTGRTRTCPTSTSPRRSTTRSFRRPATRRTLVIGAFNGSGRSRSCTLRRGPTATLPLTRPPSARRPDPARTSTSTRTQRASRRTCRAASSASTRATPRAQETAA